MPADALDRAIEALVSGLGFELVEMERGGSRTRPVLRIRIDRPNAVPGQSVSVEDCSSVNRALQALLDEDAGLGDRYVLEVSSPGVERPLVRRADFERFAGREIVVRGDAPLDGAEKRVEGVLEGIRDEPGDERILLRLPDGRLIEVPRKRITRANLVFRWPGKRG
ncbi:MAG: ribosome maturation factor RimP [Gemmatimonadetes bacterium]|nr:ribosome maturation factor RimP [Gemmatimonadota bacterium]